jgi:NTP pyrophosphatase (non-canonical NTP hydrolase)
MSADSIVLLFSKTISTSSPLKYALYRMLTIKTTGVRYFNELTNMAMLTEEVGEVARIMARRYGEQSEKASDTSKELADELADVLWVVICLANQTGVNLTAAFQKNLEKKNTRDASRHRSNKKLQ